jgi:hypothetical protein
MGRYGLFFIDGHADFYCSRTQWRGRIHGSRDSDRPGARRARRYRWVEAACAG